ncbi:hypothetical protein HCN51_39315 [Nonomuraea sp. FMUSA5-5]|uniref:MarR family transcriptional regulator n=1 Tax=Nonomuraea composti TaxID=2720023 RepID=A0ABX1BJF0_9ACTN|nr:hypothetical protein [Nonomuraea sp. FMUSA5-5]NJP95421.1 hypothetical protein [Nonomuraea sp. FMUSA5-5]
MAASDPDEEALQATIDSAALNSEDPTDEEGPIEGTHGQPDRADDEFAPDQHADEGEALMEPVADDPAWDQARAELAELAHLLNGVISAKDEGNAVMALGCLEMAMAKVASAHRNARAVLTGTDPGPARGGGAARPGTGGGAGGGVRPSALRDRVHAHLTEYPGKDFTPYEIGKVLDASSGAVANALDRLVNLGQATLTCERPRRFALTPNASCADTASDA